MAIKTILLKGQEHAIYKEAAAAAAISPGDLVVLNSSGAVLQHNLAGNPTAPAFAIENALLGETIDDQYVADAQVRYAVLQPGSEVYAWLAAGQSVAAAALLMSNGGGAFAAAGASTPLVRALNSLDNTSGAVKARLKVDVI